MIPLSKFPGTDRTGQSDSSKAFIAAERACEADGEVLYIDRPGHYRIAEVEIPAGLVGDSRFCTLIPAAAGVTMLEMPSAKGAVPLGGFSINGQHRSIPDITGIRFPEHANSVDGRGTIFFADLDGICLDIDGAYDLNLPVIRTSKCGGRKGPQVRIAGRANMVNIGAIQMQGGFSTMIDIGTGAMFTRIGFGHLEWFADGEASRGQRRLHDALVCRGYRSRINDVHVAEAKRGFVNEGPGNEFPGCISVDCEDPDVGLPGADPRGCLASVGSALRSFVGTR